MLNVIIKIDWRRKEMEKLRLLSLFSGIGAFEKALDRLNIDYKLVNYCEIDKYASKSYSTIHNVSEELNLGDITKIDTSKLSKDIDLITYGFPCQDISLAGKQKGFEDDGERTRSGLFFEALRIIEDTKPKVAIAENVKNLVSKKFKKEFEIVLSSLEETGYNNYYQVLNAKDYGIPQNRERVFIVSIRKDVDDGKFKFPVPQTLNLKLKDMLEDEVDEKYYLSDKMIKYIVAENEKWTGNNDKSVINKTIASTINTGEGSRRCDASNYMCDELPENYNLKIKEKTKKGYAEAKEGDGVYINRPHQKRGVVQKDMIQTLKTSPDVGVVIKDKINVIGNYSPSGHDASRIVHPDGIAPTVKENHGTVTATIVKDKNLWTDTQKQMITENGDVKRYINSDIVDKFEEGQCGDISFPNGYNNPDVGVVVKGKSYLRDFGSRGKSQNSEGICDTLVAAMGTGGGNVPIVLTETPLRIRKLTPKECFRLMGFDDEDFDKASKVNSNTQLYKQAGNSIVVNVLEHLLTNLYQTKDERIEETEETEEYNLFNYEKFI
jgi:DNA (cytosine-5)-methyltransferase 1